MNYLLITYDAVLEFTSGRTYQSAEFDNGAKICQLLKGVTPDIWESRRILMKACKGGVIFYTDNIERKRGVCFDLSTLKLQNVSDDTVITIFQKTLKYAVKHFEKMPLANYEKEIPKTNVALVYPYPFVAAREVDKVLIDRNSSKINRKDADFLTAYYFGNNGDVQFSQSVLQRAFEEIKTIDNADLQQVAAADATMPLDVTTLETTDLSIDASLKYDQRMMYMTDKQKMFIKAPVTGPERVEGAAGTGKTLSMILRCIHLLKENEAANLEYHIVFITHSLATKERICDIFRINWQEFDEHLEVDGIVPEVSILVTTLQEWSANHLGTNSIFESNYIDKDAAYSKGIQMLYIEQAYDTMRADKEWNAYDAIISDELKKFLNYTPKENLLEMIQREVAVTIKGRAREDYKTYLEIKRPKYSIPLHNDADHNFMFHIYKCYQESLEKIGQYDSDDIILSAIGQIDTPIWRRRRIRDGYDACFIDETHLFNLNELSLFHFINKPSCFNHIVFAIDKSQAVGEWSVDEDELHRQFEIEEDKREKFTTVFRSSREITRLAFGILSSGATLFTNFENPLEYSTSNFTREEESKCESPKYFMLGDDESMISKAFEWTDEYIKRHHVPKANVLLTCTNEQLMHDIERYAQKMNRHYEVLKSRSDSKAIRRAKDAHKYILGGIDYVGGLEFDAVVIIGVDGQRVPPAKDTSDAYHFMRYAWHNRLYVAVTRAKYAICMLGVKSYGNSVVLESSLSEGYMECS